MRAERDSERAAKERLALELARADEERERLTKELEEARKPRLISTAPKGGKWCLLWWPAITDEWVIGYRVHERWHSITGHQEGQESWGDRPEGPRLWMPLPPAQLSNEGEAG